MSRLPSPCPKCGAAGYVARQNNGLLLEPPDA